MNQPPMPTRTSEVTGRIECRSTLRMNVAFQPHWHVHLRAAGDRQHRPEIAEHDQEHEGHDVIGDRMDAHRDDAGDLQELAVAVVAGKPAQQVAQHPGQKGRDRQEPDRPRQRAVDQDRDRRRERRQRGAEIADQDPLPEHRVLAPQAAAEPVELAQRLPHHLDRFRARAAEGGRGRDRLLDRIDRRRVRDDERQIDADEDDERELKEPLPRVDRVGVHRRASVTGIDSPRKAAEASASPPPPCIVITSRA